jgi:uncharacterized coiled-coil protein SlyX
MMKIFSETRSKVTQDAEASGTAQPADAEASPQEDRLAQGIELLFGHHLREQREEIQRVEADLGERLDGLKKESARQGQAIELLADKVTAGLERERGELQRRKGVEAELHKRINEFSEMVSGALSDLNERTAELERRFEAFTAERPTGGEEVLARHEETLRQLGHGLAELQTGVLARQELAAQLAALASRLERGPARRSEPDPEGSS